MEPFPCKFIVSLSVLDYVEKILRGEERGKDHGENDSIKENAVFQDQLLPNSISAHFFSARHESKAVNFSHPCSNSQVKVTAFYDLFC